MLVVDASALVAWVMPDEAGRDLEAQLLAADRVCAPSLLWAELRNILIVSERRGRLPLGLADEIAASVDDLGIVLEPPGKGAAVMALARRHGLTVYDALYLELALRQGAALASLDRALVDAARAEGLEVV